MALQFSNTQVDNTLALDNFLGLDYETFETSVDPRRSNEAKNMIVNQNGYVEKRTGYKRVFDNGAGRINGIFTYHAKWEELGNSDNVIIRDINIIHIGTELYTFEFDGDSIVKSQEPIFSGIGDAKTRAFEFGGSLYIIGAGYIKVGIDKLTKGITCGYVREAGSRDYYLGSEEIITGRTPGNLDGIPKAVVDGRYAMKAITYTRPAVSGGTLTNASNFNTEYKFLIANASDATGLSVRDVYIKWKDQWKLAYWRQSSGGDTWYTKAFDIFSDEENGLYVKLNEYAPFVFHTSGWADIQEVRVIVAGDCFSYAPTIIGNREPVWIANMETKIDESTEFSRYTGQVTKEPLNLASGLKAIQFFFDESKIKEYGGYSAGVARLYLMPNQKNYVYQIKINDLIYNFTSYDEITSDRESRMYDEEGNLVGYEYWPAINLDSTKFVDISCHFLTMILGLSTATITVYFYSKLEDAPIDKCNIYGIFGGDNDSRVFMTGNSEYPCRDYSSEIYNGTYFPDDFYYVTDVGGDNSKIKGYHKFYSSQIIIKDDNGDGSTQWLRSYDGGGQFSLLQGHNTFGANCISSFKSIGDYPLYIGEGGVYILYGTNVKQQTNTACKSLLINRKFTKEDTENMICAAYKNRYYYVYTNNSFYVCDTENEYEWFYFDNMPDITCLWIYDRFLYFGDENGRIYRFMEENEKNAYCDNVSIDGEADEETKAIHALWTIPQSIFGAVTNYKTIRNVHIACMPYVRSGLTLYYNSDEELLDKVLDNEKIDMFSWEAMDFSRFSFVTIKQPKGFATRVKNKNVFTFGMTIENKEINEPFGFIGLTVTFRTGKVVK